MKKLTIYECHSLGDRSPLSMCDTLAGAAAFISSYASWRAGRSRSGASMRTTPTAPTPS